MTGASARYYNVKQPPFAARRPLGPRSHSTDEPRSLVVLPVQCAVDGPAPVVDEQLALPRLPRQAEQQECALKDARNEILFAQWVSVRTCKWEGGDGRCPSRSS